jgi:hypothetical protein
MGKGQRAKGVLTLVLMTCQADDLVPLAHLAYVCLARGQGDQIGLGQFDVVDLVDVHKAVTRGDDEGDPSPAGADDGWDLVFQEAELECIVPSPGAGMVRLGGDQVAAGDQFVALDGGVVVDGPPNVFVNPKGGWMKKRSGSAGRLGLRSRAAKEASHPQDRSAAETLDRMTKPDAKNPGAEWPPVNWIWAFSLFSTRFIRWLVAPAPRQSQKSGQKALQWCNPVVE